RNDESPRQRVCAARRLLAVGRVRDTSAPSVPPADADGPSEPGQLARGVRERAGEAVAETSDEVGQLLEDDRLRAGAGDLLDELTVLKDLQRRDAGHVVLRG